MDIFNRFYRFGSIVKPKASLYTVAIIFFVGISNTCFNITTIDILALLEIFIISFVVALIEYFLYEYERVQSIGYN